MRRNHEQAGDSLELFLDTICNMFGGILFIAILVVILLKNSSLTQTVEVVPTVDPLEYAKLERRYFKIQDEMRRLEQSMTSSKKIEKMLSNPEHQKLFAQWKQLEKKLTESIQKQVQKAEQLAQQIKELGDLQDEHQKVAIELAEGKKLIEKNQTFLHEVQQSKTKDLFLPEQNYSSKWSIDVFLKYNRLYFWFTYPSVDDRGPMNVEDIAIIEETEYFIRTTPKPYRGIPLTNNPKVIEELRQKFSRFSPQKCKIIVWTKEDSFEGFSTLQNYLVENHYQYAPVPLSNDLEGVIRDRGGSDKPVQ